MEKKDVQVVVDAEQRTLPSLAINGYCYKTKEVPDSEKEISNKRASKWRKCFILFCLCFNNFWSLACISLQAPFFPQEAELKGSTPTEYGLVFSVFEIAKFAASPLWGKMISIVNPKILIAGGALLEGVFCVLFGFLEKLPAGKIYIGSAFATRILEGIGASALEVVAFSIVASEFPDSVGKAISMLQASRGLAFIAGPAVGGALYEVGGFTLPFTVVGRTLIIGAILLLLLMPRIGTAHLLQKHTNKKAFLLNWYVVFYGLTVVTAMIFIGFNATSLEPHMRKFHLPPSLLGAIFIASAGMYALSTPLWGFAIDRGVDISLIVILGYFLSIAAILFIGPAPFIPIDATVWSVVSSLLLIGLGVSSKITASFTGVLKSTLACGFPDDMVTYGMVSALFSSSISIGSLLGSAIGGFLLDNIGYENSTLVLLAEECVLMLSLTVYILQSKLKKNSGSVTFP